MEMKNRITGCDHREGHEKCSSPCPRLIILARNDYVLANGNK